MSVFEFFNVCSCNSVPRLLINPNLVNGFLVTFFKVFIAATFIILLKYVYVFNIFRYIFSCPPSCCLLSVDLQSGNPSYNLSSFELLVFGCHAVDTWTCSPGPSNTELGDIGICGRIIQVYIEHQDGHADWYGHCAVCCWVEEVGGESLSWNIAEFLWGILLHSFDMHTWTFHVCPSYEVCWYQCEATSICFTNLIII